MQCHRCSGQAARPGYKAVIVPGHGYEPTRELELAIKEFCNRRLAEYKWVRLVEFVSAMPKTISGKIKKTELRKG